MQRAIESSSADCLANQIRDGLKRGNGVIPEACGTWAESSSPEGLLAFPQNSELGMPEQWITKCRQLSSTMNCGH
jgi:hypothetical protein